MKKRVVKLSIIGFALVSLLAACGNNNNTTQDNSTTPRAETSAQATPETTPTNTTTPSTGNQPPANLAAEPEDMFTYVFDNDLQGIRLTKYHGELTQVKLPDEIAGHPIVAIDGSTFIVGHVTDVFYPDTLVEFIWGGGNLVDDPLTHLVIPYGVTHLQRITNTTRAGKIRQITIPDTVRHIAGDTFNGFTSLMHLSLPYGIEEIDLEIFSRIRGGLTNVVTIDVPDTVINITETGGTYQPIKDTGWWSAQPDGFVYFGKIVVGWKGDITPNTTVTIADGTVSIAPSAFHSTQLTSVTIPDSVTHIGKNAFLSSQLTSVNIPNSVTHIGGGAFFRTQLTSVTIPDSVTRIEERTFAETQLTSVTIPNSVTYIDTDAFRNNPLDEPTRQRILEINPDAKFD